MTREEAQAQREKQARSFLSGKKMRLTRRIRAEIRRIDPDWGQHLHPAPRQDPRRPRVFTSSGLVVEQSPAEDMFTSLVLGWRGLKR